MSETPAGGRTPRIHRLGRSLSGLLVGERSEPEIGWDVRNETPWPIWVDRDGVGVLTLAPLERRTVRNPLPAARGAGGEVARHGLPAVPAPLAEFRLERLVERGQLSVRPLAPESEATRDLTSLLRAAAVLAFTWALSGLLLPRPAWLGAGAVLAAVLAVAVFLLLTRPGTLGEARRVRRWTFQSLTMVAVHAVAVLAPALALWSTTSMQERVRLTGDAPWVQVTAREDVVPRLLQLTLIATASLLPALMFFQFDAERVSTLRDRWTHTIFRFDATLATVSDVEAKYGQQIEEAYGKPSDGRGRLTRGRRSPLIVATVMMTFGWLLVLLNTDPRLDDGQLDPVTLVTPTPTTTTYAFLGAYFFGLNVVYNAYVRGDLRPKTYNLLTVRVLLALVLAWLIDLAFAGGSELPGDWAVYGLAFAAGIVPRTVLHWAGERLEGLLTLGSGAGPKVDASPPRARLSQLAEVVSSGEELRRLDGIDLYERTRLSDEGITTLQALAHHDLVDLFFKTRISAARLVDWVDQAVLQLYLEQVPGVDRAGDVGAVTALRRQGIRTATDFTRAVEVPDKRDSVVRALRSRTAGASDVDGCVELLKQTLSDSEWAGPIRRWRRSELTAVEAAERLYLDGNGDLCPGDPRFSRSVQRNAPAQHAPAGPPSTDPEPVPVPVPNATTPPAAPGTGRPAGSRPHRSTRPGLAGLLARLQPGG